MLEDILSLKNIYTFPFGNTGCLFFLLFTFFISSCTKKFQFNNANSITVTNWNLQTFFDGNNDGIEYSDFRKSKNLWNEDFYEERLDRLCKLIEEIDSDVFVMEEIENEKILYDISNKLSHNCWYRNKIYNYAAFGKENGNSIGLGVISKYPIENIKFHGLDVRTENEKAPQMRALMEVNMSAGNKNICMYVNHWKSKSGGEEKSEKWRLWQENILAREFSNAFDSDINFATGDFNKDYFDFTRNEHNDFLFNGIGETKTKQVMLYSPWNDVTDEGSYFFRGKWEKIDHFFFAEKNRFSDFKVIKNDKILKSDGTPARYELYNHTGYSDHLPITCRIILDCPERG